jgi:hypothetical protein
MESIGTSWVLASGGGPPNQGQPAQSCSQRGMQTMSRQVRLLCTHTYITCWVPHTTQPHRVMGTHKQPLEHVQLLAAGGAHKLPLAIMTRLISASHMIICCHI